MPKISLRGEEGQVLVMWPFLLILLLAVTGGVVDLGSAYVTQTDLQSALDSGALAAAQGLENGHSRSSAVTAANQLVAENGYSDVVFHASQPQSGPYTVNFGANDTVKLTARYQAPTYFLKLFGQKTMPVTVTAKATAGISPAFGYAFFANQDMNFGDEKANTQLNVNGSIHSNGTMENHYKKPDIQGVVEYGSGSAPDDMDTAVKHAAIPMPKFNPAQYTQGAPEQSSIDDENVHGDVTFPKTVYVNGTVTIGAKGNLECTTIVATGDITLDVNNIVNASGSGPVAIISENGSITMEANNLQGADASSPVLLYAPQGTVSFLGNNIHPLHGSVVAQKIQIDANNVHDVTYDSSVKNTVKGGTVRLIN